MSLDPELVPSPVRAWLPAEFDFEAPRQGQTSAVAFVTTAPVVVKRTQGALYTSWLEQEHNALVALADSDLPLPEALGLHIEPNDCGGEGWLVMSRLPGEPMTELVTRARTTEARAELYRRLGTLAARVHTAAIPSALRPDDPRPWVERVLERVREVRRRWARRLTARLDEDGTNEALQTLIHGDLTIDNVLGTADEITGIIDWGGAGPGDPRWDVTLALSPHNGTLLAPSVVAAFFEGYGSHRLPNDLRAFLEDAYDL